MGDRHDDRPRAFDKNKARLACRLKEEGEHSVDDMCSSLEWAVLPCRGTSARTTTEAIE